VKIVEFVKQLRDVSSGKVRKFYDYILKHGKQFEGFIPSYNFIEVRLLTKVIRPQLKQCYYNSGILTLLSRGKYKYYEGFALDKELPIPLQHAWNVTEDNKVVDLTWEKTVEKSENIEYFGVEVPYEFIKKIGRKGLTKVLTPLELYFREVIDKEE